MFTESLSNFTNSNSAALITSPTNAYRISHLYIQNVLATTPHWINLTNTNVSGGAVLCSFYNSGHANFALMFDSTYFAPIVMSGFTIVRSSTPEVTTLLASNLTNPSYIAASYTFITGNNL